VDVVRVQHLSERTVENNNNNNNNNNKQTRQMSGLQAEISTQGLMNINQDY
jgi:hypothetical protein